MKEFVHKSVNLHQSVTFMICYNLPPDDSEDPFRITAIVRYIDSDSDLIMDICSTQRFGHNCTGHLYL